MRVEYIVVSLILMLIVLAIVLAMLGALPDVPSAIDKLVSGK